MERERIIELLNADVDSLYAELGEELTSPSIMPRPLQKLVVTSKEWLAKNREAFRNVICGNEEIVKYLNKDSSTETKVHLVTAVLDLIASICIGVSPVTVSVLLVREGIEKLCAQEHKAL